MQLEVGGLLFVDAHVSARLEQGEGKANASFVDARRRISPEMQADSICVAGAYALFDGVESPLTQTFGLGMGGEVGADEFEQIEEFYRKRSSPVFHEVSALVDVELLLTLGDRGYRPVELSNVLCCAIDGNSVFNRPVDSPVKVRVIRAEECDQWAQTSAAGWSEYAAMSDFILAMGRNFVATAGAVAMQAEIDGVPVATGVVYIIDGVAILAGASTIPTARKRGAQSALLAARLEYAANQGCDLAMMCALPGSASQRNAQRNGFQVAYTRTKWKLFEAFR